MANHQVHTGRDINIGGHFVVADAIENSFNTVAASQAPDHLKETLRQLSTAVKEMCEALPEDQQKEAAQDFQTLATEAVKESPSRKYLKLAADGLIELSKTAGKMVVTALVTSLLQRWGV